MAEPFDSMKAYFEKSGLWLTLLGSAGKFYHHSVKLSKGYDAFYIGNDNAHITILKGSAGFHHTVAGDTGPQHTSATTVADIIEHLDYNAGIYKEPWIRKALVYIKDNM